MEAQKSSKNDADVIAFDDVNDKASNKKGTGAVIENIFRKFQTIGFVLLLVPIVGICGFCFGVAFTPGIFLTTKVYQWLVAENVSALTLAFGIGMALAVSLLCFILSLIIIVPIVNFPVTFFVKPNRGAWFSIESIPWYLHNALTYIVRYTILDFITPSPLNIFFFKMMGMKIGKGVLLNTSNISDPCLIVIEDYVTIGGSVYMMAHYGMKGFLIIDRLHIKKGAMVGLAAKLLGGVTIGEKAVVLPNVAVLPKTIIKPGEKFKGE